MHFVSVIYLLCLLLTHLLLDVFTQELASYNYSTKDNYHYSHVLMHFSVAAVSGSIVSYEIIADHITEGCGVKSAMYKGLLGC